MSETIFLSVVIPTYHRNDLLALCLDRLAPTVQSISNSIYEVIVTDDGIKDTAQALLLEKYPWAKWIEGPQKGPAANRNNGAKHALGNWLVFTDDDCLPEPMWLLSYFEGIVKNPNVQVFEGKTICKLGLKSPLETAPINENGGFLWSCNFAIKKSVFELLHGFNTNFPFPNMEDVDFRERIKKNEMRFIFISNAIIDHPPRRMKLGKELAKQHESNYFYWKKIEKRRYVNFYLIKEILKFRLKAIIKYGGSKDTLIAINSMFSEIFATILLVRYWGKKYS